MFFLGQIKGADRSSNRNSSCQGYDICMSYQGLLMKKYQKKFKGKAKVVTEIVGELLKF